MESSQVDKQNYTYIFSYGSNHPFQLAQRLERKPEDIIDRAVSCTLKDFERVYAGVSRTWGGKSPASVMQSPGNFCQGVAFKLDDEEIARLNVFEGYPRMYDRVDVKLTLHNYDRVTKKVEDQEVMGQVYQMVDTSQFEDPVERYLQACSKTLYFHHKLKGIGEDSAANVSIVIKRANDMQIVREFKWQVTFDE